MTYPPNYSLADLSIDVTDAGFILGVSRLGDALGSGDGYRIDVRTQLRALSITKPRRVDDDLYIGKDVSTATLTCLFEDAPTALRGKRLIVEYRGQQLFTGLVKSATRSVEYDQDVPGDRKWSVSITASDVGERAAGYRVNIDGAAEASLTAGLLARVPYLTTVDVADSVLDRVRSYRWGASTIQTTTVRELFNQVEQIASCIVVTDPDSSGAVSLVGYDDGARWDLYDDAYPSFSALSFSEGQDGATSVRVTPTGAPDETTDGLSTAPGLLRQDVDKTLDVPIALEAAQAVANSLPVIGSVPERLASISLPFSEGLDLSADPTSVTARLDSRTWTAAVVSVQHDITPRGWGIDLDCAPEHLLTRVGSVAPAPVTGLDEAGAVLTWTDSVSRSATAYAVTWRADGVWAQHPADYTGTASVDPGEETYDLSGLPADTYQVNVWALGDTGVYSIPATIEVVVP